MRWSAGAAKTVGLSGVATSRIETHWIDVGRGRPGNYLIGKLNGVFRSAGYGARSLFQGRGGHGWWRADTKRNGHLMRDRPSKYSHSQGQAPESSASSGDKWLKIKERTLLIEI